MSACENKLDFEGVKAALGSSVVLDVRTNEELETHGQIEGSGHVSQPELESALALDGPAFAAQYGFPKPGLDAPILTHCMKGHRAQMAADALVAKGYSKVSVYCGSFSDWMVNGGDIKPGKPFSPSK